MADPYHELLDATIGYLEELKRSGHQWIKADARILEQFDSAAATPRHAKPSTNTVAPVQAKASSAPVKTESPEPVPIITPTSSTIITPDISPDKAAADFTRLRETVLACQKCPNLVRSRKSIVFGVGTIEAKLMFVGEAPGADEDVQGEPFVGAAGQLLTRIIQTMGFSRETVYIANVLKCRPDTPGQSFGNRKPTPEEMKTCLPYLLEQIHLIRPQVIVALGATAMEGLFGRPMPITKLRGQWQSFENTPVMPTFHPSYLLRNQAPAVKRQVWEDMLQVLEKLGAPISEKQRNYFKT